MDSPARCWRCGCCKSVALLPICCAKGTYNALLCERCVPGHWVPPGGIIVTDKLDSSDGLVALMAQSVMAQHGASRGNLADIIEGPSCLMCQCIVGVETCHPLRRGPSGRIHRNFGVALPLCDDCRSCVNCDAIIVECEGVQIDEHQQTVTCRACVEMK